MERLRIAYKLGRVLDECGFQDAHTIASAWVEKDKERADFWNDRDKETYASLKSIIGNIEEIDHPLGIADAFVNGKNNIDQVYEYLIKFGYTEGELSEYYRKNLQVFSLKNTDIEPIANYLKSIFTEKDVKKVLLDAILLGCDEIRQRTQLVLELFDSKSFLLFLIQERMLFYPYYVDVVDALKTLNSVFGPILAKAFLEADENALFLYQYKKAEYRVQYSSQFSEAMESISKFKKKVLETISNLDNTNKKELLQYHFAEEIAKTPKETADAFSVSVEKVKQLIGMLYREISIDEKLKSMIDKTMDDVFK